jgi:hypothetical protein
MLSIFSFPSVFNLADHRLINAKLFCQVFTGNSGGKRSPYGVDCLVWDFGFVVIFANNVLTAFKRVLSVFALSSDDKVRRINALGVIA